MNERNFGDPRIPARVWAKIDVEPVTGCWLWTGRPNRDGYCRVQVDGRGHRVHRYVYATLVRPLGPGEVIDHVCHSADPTCFDGPDCLHRRCCNPEHLEPTTHAINAGRAHAPARLLTECPAGHPYDEQNTRWYKGWRYCEACAQDTKAERSARYRERHPTRVAAAQRQYRETHRDERSAAFADWRARNLEHDRARVRAYRERDPERHRQRCRDYRERKRAEREAAATRR